MRKEYEKREGGDKVQNIIRDFPLNFQRAVP
jgi:hypothetical protein